MEAQPSNGFIHEKVIVTQLAIGYVGFAYLDDKVKALPIDGIAPIEETVLNGTYPIARDLNMFTVEEPGVLVTNFLQFIFSIEGQVLVAQEGFIALKGSTNFSMGNFPVGTEMSIVGSTTVLPIGAIAAQRYMDLNPNVSISVSGGGSSTGIKSIGERTADIGMASRELKESEITDYPFLMKHVVAKDGIAIITNLRNDVNDLSLEALKKIYLGEYVTWREVKLAINNLSEVPLVIVKSNHRKKITNKCTKSLSSFKS
jgi:phosphate transport system substrate-binding protein